MFMEDNRERIVIPDDVGEEHVFDVLFTFQDESLGHDYIVVTPSDQSESEEVEVYGFRYEEDPENEDLTLFQVEDEEEWKRIEEELDVYSSSE